MQDFHTALASKLPKTSEPPWDSDVVGAHNWLIVLIFTDMGYLNWLI